MSTHRGHAADGTGAPVHLHVGLACVHGQWDCGALQGFLMLEQNDPVLTGIVYRMLEQAEEETLPHT